MGNGNTREEFGQFLVIVDGELEVTGMVLVFLLSRATLPASCSRTSTSRTADGSCPNLSLPTTTPGAMVRASLPDGLALWQTACRKLCLPILILLTSHRGGQAATEFSCNFDLLYTHCADIRTIFISDWSHKANQLEYSPAISFLVHARCCLHRLGVAAS